MQLSFSVALLTERTSNPIGAQCHRPKEPEQPQNWLEEGKVAVIRPKVSPNGAANQRRIDITPRTDKQGKQRFYAENDYR